jgi:hypothetical protein
MIWGSFEPLQPRLEIQIDMVSTSEKIDIERTKKTAEHVFDVLGRNGSAVIGLGAPIFLMFSRGERALQLWLDSEPITFMSVREENNAVGLERRAYIGVTDFFA